MPLSLATINEDYRIVKINYTENKKQHLNDLGFIEGSKVKVLSSNMNGLIVLVKDARIAISKEVAMHIMV